MNMPIYNGRTYDKVLYHYENLIFNKLANVFQPQNLIIFPGLLFIEHKHKRK
jgi:hypothetical protein